MEQWEKAEQKLMYQIWKRREHYLKMARNELRERTGLVMESKVRFRSAACAVQYIQNQAMMMGLVGSLKENSSSNKKKGDKSKSVYKKDLQEDHSSNTTLKTWEEQKIKEIIARQADVDALANMLVINTS